MSNAAAFDEQAGMLMEGCEFGDPQLEASMRDRLRARLAVAADERRALRVYTGYDPTAPDLHERTHQLGGQPDVIPEVTLHDPMHLVDLLVSIGAASSKSDARRLIAGRGVSLNGQKAPSGDWQCAMLG